MTDKMQAIFTDTRLLRAAAWLAKHGSVPLLSFTRNGEHLHVMGSNAYVMIEGDVKAEFEGWDDGDGKVVRDFHPIKQIARALKRDNFDYPCSVTFEDGGATVDLWNGDMSYKAVFTNIGKPPTMRDNLTDEAEGSALMSIDHLDYAVAVMRKMGMAVNAWRVVPHGKNKAMFFLLEDSPLTEERNVRVMAMPMRED